MAINGIEAQGLPPETRQYIQALERELARLRQRDQQITQALQRAKIRI